MVIFPFFFRNAFSADGHVHYSTSAKQMKGFLLERRLLLPEMRVDDQAARAMKKPG